MKSRTSFFNGSIIFDDIRRFGWISAIYGLVLLFFVPLRLITLYSSPYGTKQTIRNIFYYQSDGVQCFLVMIVPVLLGILLFRYIQVKTESDMLHSLPVKRAVMYRSHVLVGILILLLPVMLTAGIVFIINAALGLQQYFNTSDILCWAGVTVLMNLLFFITSVFVGMNVGLSTAQGVLTYLLLYLPAGLVLLVSGCLSTLLYGYMSNTYRLFRKISPIGRITDGFMIGDRPDIMTTAEIIAYIAVCIILFFAAQLLYNKRKLEAASHTIAFKGLDQVLIYGATLCATLLGGYYFQQTDLDIGWIALGYAAGSLLGYFAAQMLVKKTFWVFKDIKGYAIYAVVAVLVFAGIRFDVLGYESYIPAEKDIESVYFGNSIREGYPAFYDKKNIDSIYALHQQLIKAKSHNKYDKGVRNDYMVFEYTLKNGKKVRRGYNVRREDYARYIKPIYEAVEYKEIYSDLLNAKASDIQIIRLSPAAGLNKGMAITEPADIAEALQALKADIYAESYEQMTDDKTPWAYMEMAVSPDSVKNFPSLNNPYDVREEKTIGIYWRKSYTQFETWLAKKGYLANARALPEDIDYAVVEKIDSREVWKNMNTGQNHEYDSEKSLKITDKAQLEACLRDYTYLSAWDDDKWRSGSGRYYISFFGNGGSRRSVETGSFEENAVPDFIRAYFK